MSPEQGRRVYAVFEAAPRCDPARRAIMLEGMCIGDDQLRAEVKRLLAQDAEAERDGFMATPASPNRVANRPGQSTAGKTEFDWPEDPRHTGAENSDPEPTLPASLAAHPVYTVKRELGRGGMGVVYLAENRLMGRYEVLKVMGQQVVERPEFLDRFLREIRAVAKLHHPNIVTAYHADRLGESVIFAMEYVDGLDLSRLVRARGPLPVAHACSYIHQAALALAHAHERGMVHRDVKPGNLMLTREGERATIKVLDFGLAKVKSEGMVEGAHAQGSTSGHA